MKALVRILLLLVLAAGAVLVWNALRVRQIHSAWRTVGVIPVRRLDLGLSPPVPLPREGLTVRTVAPGGPRIGELLEVLDFDPAGLSFLSSPAAVGRAYALAKMRVGEFGGARIAVFDYRGFRGLKLESGHDARYRVFGPDGQERLLVGVHEPKPGEGEGLLRAVLDGRATSAD